MRMKALKRLSGLCVAVVVVAGCSTAEVTSGQYYAQNQKLERPGNILVYDFAASAADIPASIPLNTGYDAPSAPPTAEELAAGRALGAEVAKQLVAEIHDMGMPAEQAIDGTPRHVGDMIIAGYFTSVDEGSRTKRMAIGFGSGAAEISTEAAGFLVTEQGLRLLGSRTVDSRRRRQRARHDRADSGDDRDRESHRSRRGRRGKGHERGDREDDDRGGGQADCRRARRAAAPGIQRQGWVE
jgi:hypothetical protein